MQAVVHKTFHERLRIALSGQPMPTLSAVAIVLRRFFESLLNTPLND